MANSQDNKPYTVVGCILCYADQEIADWIADHINGCTKFEPEAALGVMRNGKLAAGVGYYNRIGHSIEIIFASVDPRWATKQVIFSIFDYAFRGLKCRRVHSLVKPDNYRAIKLNEGVGMVLEGRPRKILVDNQGEHDALLYGLLKEEFYSGKYGQGKSNV